MAAVQGADVVMEVNDEVNNHDQVLRGELTELMKQFHVDGHKSLAEFVKSSNAGQWPCTYESMKDAVSNYYRFLESMCLSQVGQEVALKKYSEVTKEGLGEVSHEVTAMSWLRPHIPESEA